MEKREAGGGGQGGEEGEAGRGEGNMQCLSWGLKSSQDTETAVDSSRPRYVVEIHSDAGQTAGVKTCKAHLEQQA